MPNSPGSLSIPEWVENLLQRGRIAFSIEMLREAYPHYSDSALKLILNRLFKKGKAISIHKGFYLIISPQYASRGILPPPIYLDTLMKYLNRPYYLGLLNAASFYGAAHQQPQEFFVFTNYPQLRPVNKKGIKVNYISIQEIPGDLLEERKTESGYLKISSSQLTAANLVQFEKKIGGLSRAATVLNELCEEIKLENLNKEFLRQVPTATLQRLGYILDQVLKKEEIASHLYAECLKADVKFQKVALKASQKKNGFPINEKWKIIINAEIEFEE
jgi:predicted transcriptional regulator of viral defense system